MMKTPREILFDRHRDAEARLEQVRRAVLAKVLAEQEPAPRTEPSVLSHLVVQAWQELIWPVRRVWAGLAVLWFVLLGINLTTPEESSATRNSEPPTAAMLREAVEQRQVLSKLIQSPGEEPSEPPRQHPQSRSEGHKATLQV